MCAEKKRKARHLTVAGFLRCVGAALTAVILSATLSSCGSTDYADGDYEGRSAVYEGEEDGSAAGYGVAQITVKDNVIVACDYHTYEPDGTLKDEDYGKQNGEVANRDFYNKAQRAVQACEKYAEALAQKGKLADVDAISGATISYNEFIEAVNDALDQAKQ